MLHLRILFADDEPDIREIIDLSLSLDPLFELRNCPSGKDVPENAIAWRPDLILLDVMMPVMDGPTTLAQLRTDRRTAAIPVVFMTARTQAHECAHFTSLGAAGVIPKPFDPMELPASVRRYLPADIDATSAHNGFQKCLGEATTALAACRTALAHAHAHRTLIQIKDIANTLAGNSARQGFTGIGLESAALQEAADDDLAGHGMPMQLEHAIDRVLSRIALH